jgi:uncharacterized repeat protein (TIGR03943 family)
MVVSFMDNKIKVSNFALIVLIMPLVFGFFSNPLNIETNSYQPIKATSVQITSTNPNIIEETQIIEDNAEIFKDEFKLDLNYSDLKFSSIINDSNFLDKVYEISRDPKKYEGRKIKIEGKLFKDKIDDKDHLFLGRFWIWHCFFDARIVGFDLIYNNSININETGWYSVDGIVVPSLYKDHNITLIEVIDLKEVNYVGEQYVY